MLELTEGYEGLLLLGLSVPGLYCLLARSLKEHPNLLNQLSELLARRQMETQDVLAAQLLPNDVEAEKVRYTAGFLHKLRTFLEL